MNNVNKKDKSDLNKDDDDDDYDDGEEEEVIVYANFEEGSFDKEIFQRPDLKFKIVGLDSDYPVVQLGDTTFKGAWKDAIGTKVFFEEDFSPEQVDPVFTVLPPKMLKYKCMTTKTLELSRIFLKPKFSENELEDSGKTENLNLNLKNNLSNIVEKEEILKLAQSTVCSDSDTDKIMNDIVNETTMNFND